MGGWNLKKSLFIYFKMTRRKWNENEQKIRESISNLLT